jgi:hypothetical protein
VRILGRVLFSAKVEPAKTEPKINWSEIEARLLGISKPAQASELPIEASLLAEPSSLPIAPSAMMAHDLDFSDEPPATRDQPVSIPGDPLEMLTMLAAISSDRS